MTHILGGAARECCSGRSKKAFTLAETLITLVVVGVIASILIFNLYTDVVYNNLHKMLVNEHRILSGAALAAKQDNGGSITNYFSPSSNSLTFRDLFGKYINFQKTCGLGDQACYKFLNITNMIGGIVPWNTDVNVVKATLVITVRGSVYKFYSSSNNCTSVFSAKNNLCGTIIVDVNGSKAPNRLGIDVFEFFFTDDARIVPGGSIENIYGYYTNPNDWNKWCNLSSTTYQDNLLGAYCAAKALTDGNLNYSRK